MGPRSSYAWSRKLGHMKTGKSNLAVGHPRFAKKRINMNRFMGFMMLSLCCLLIIMTSGSSKTRPPRRLFLVSEPLPQDNFVILLENPELIQMATKIIAGQVTDQIHVSGRIVKGRIAYNGRWNFHLDPTSIRFFTFASTTCGRAMLTSDVQANLDLVGKPGSPLATGYWCPWGSKVVAELK